MIRNDKEPIDICSHDDRCKACREIGESNVGFCSPTAVWHFRYSRCAWQSRKDSEIYLLHRQIAFYSTVKVVKGCGYV